MQFLVLIAALIAIPFLIYYGRRFAYYHFTQYQRSKYSLIILTVNFTGLIIFFIYSLVKYFNYLSLITLILFIAFTYYTIRAGLLKLKKLKPI